MKSFAFIGSIFFCLIGHAQNAWKITTAELIYKNPPFAQCHASTIVEVNPNKRMAACFGGTHEGNKDVGIWLSTQENGKWNKPVSIADGEVNDTLRYPLWNPVLFKAKEGKLFLFYKMGPSPREWWGMVRTSSDDGKTWTPSKKLPAGILGPIKNKTVQLADGTILAPSSTETKESWKVHMVYNPTTRGNEWFNGPAKLNVAVSKDGKQWTDVLMLENGTKEEYSYPAVIQTKDGKVHITYTHDRKNVKHVVIEPGN